MDKKLYHYLGVVEHGLKGQMAGKTLLGEIVFRSKDCDEIAAAFKEIVTEKGPRPAFQLIAKRWPYCLTVWLTNEAFYNFQSGEYWPPVLKKVGIDDPNPYSASIGKSYVNILRDKELPRFKQLKTRWSYLGPILAHCGIPASCLPEFFEKAVPKAAELGVGDGVGFAELIGCLRQLYLTRPTERFIRFGGKIAEDFVRRSVQLNNFAGTHGVVPDARLVGLPERVVQAFGQWRKRTAAVVRGPARLARTNPR